MSSRFNCACGECRNAYRQGYNDGVQNRAMTEWLWGPTGESPETD